MLRFALLRHECPPDYREGPHWDLMLEREGRQEEHRLATWSLLQLPPAWLSPPRDASEPTTPVVGAIQATRLPVHRAKYLDYEGPISGDRGTVRRVAGGSIRWIEAGENRCRVELLADSPFAGLVTIEAIDPIRWTLTVG